MILLMQFFSQEKEETVCIPDFFPTVDSAPGIFESTGVMAPPWTTASPPSLLVKLFGGPWLWLRRPCGCAAARMDRRACSININPPLPPSSPQGGLGRRWGQLHFLLPPQSLPLGGEWRGGEGGRRHAGGGGGFN
jgi:hypothetical protein